MFFRNTSQPEPNYEATYMYNPEYREQLGLLYSGNALPNQQPQNAPIPGMSQQQTMGIANMFTGLGGQMMNNEQEQPQFLVPPQLQPSNPFAFLGHNNPYYGGQHAY